MYIHTYDEQHARHERRCESRCGLARGYLEKNWRLSLTFVHVRDGSLAGGGAATAPRNLLKASSTRSPPRCQPPPWRCQTTTLIFLGGKPRGFVGAGFAHPGTEEDPGAAFAFPPPLGLPLPPRGAGRGFSPLTGTSSPRGGPTAPRGALPSMRPPQKRDKA